MKRPLLLIIAIMLLGVGVAGAAKRRDLNDQLLNRPYSDQRPWHLGFSIGAYAGGLNFTHNGHIAPDGPQWRIEQPDYQPGFCVNGLAELRLTDYLSLRFTPGMYFGSYDVQMRDMTTGDRRNQNIKNAYVVAPIELKYSALRHHNYRPYVVGGVMEAFDVSKRRSDYIKLAAADTYLTVGFGCDLYLPYFKLVPELKFGFGLGNLLQTKRPDLEDDPGKMVITESLQRVSGKMIVLTFYFE